MFVSSIWSGWCVGLANGSETYVYVVRLPFLCMDLKLEMYETRVHRGWLISWMQGKVLGLWEVVGVAVAVEVGDGV